MCWSLSIQDFLTVSWNPFTKPVSENIGVSQKMCFKWDWWQNLLHKGLKDWLFQEKKSDAWKRRIKPIRGRSIDLHPLFDTSTISPYTPGLLWEILMEWHVLWIWNIWMPAVTSGSKCKTLIMQKYRCCRFNR